MSTQTENIYDQNARHHLKEMPVRKMLSKYNVRIAHGIYEEVIGMLQQMISYYIADFIQGRLPTVVESDFLPMSTDKLIRSCMSEMCITHASKKEVDDIRYLSADLLSRILDSSVGYMKRENRKTLFVKDLQQARRNFPEYLRLDLFPQ